MNLSPGTIVSLTITDIAFGGEGVARLNDFVVFVPFVLVGEEVEAELSEIKKNFAQIYSCGLRTVISTFCDLQ